MKRILVIGGTGMVGPGVVRAFTRAGDAVTVLHRGRTPHAFDAPVEVVTLDRSEQDFSSYLLAARFDLIIDLACFSIEDATSLVASVRLGQPVFVASTVLVHGGPVSRPLNERSTLSPLSDYAKQKYGIEEVFRTAHTHGRVRATILRLGTCYRPGCYLDGQLFEDSYWLHDLQRGRRTILLDEGNAIWTALHSDDCGDILVALSHNEAAQGETILIANPESITWNGYYRVLAHAVAGVFRPCYIPADWIVAQLGQCFPSEMSRWDQRYDLGKLTSLIGHIAMRPLQSGLAETATIYANQAALDQEMNAREDALLTAWDART